MDNYYTSKYKKKMTFGEAIGGIANNMNEDIRQQKFI